MVGNFCHFLENAKNHPTLARHCDQTIQLELNYGVSFERYWTYLYVHVHLACPWLRTQKLDFTATFYYSSLNKTTEFSPPKLLCSKTVQRRQVSLITSRKVPKNLWFTANPMFNPLEGDLMISKTHMPDNANSRVFNWNSHQLLESYSCWNACK